MTLEHGTSDDSAAEYPDGHPLAPDPFEHPLESWERTAADGLSGDSWLFVAHRGDPAYGDRGATAYDPVAGVRYRATIDGYDRLTHIEVVIPGNRLGASIDAERAGRELREFAINHSKPEGAAASTPPSPEVIADLIERNGWGRNDLAKWFGRPVRTVDRWMRDARAALPDRMPPPSRGRAAQPPVSTSPAKTPAGNRPAGNRGTAPQPKG